LSPGGRQGGGPCSANGEPCGPIPNHAAVDVQQSVPPPRGWRPSISTNGEVLVGPARDEEINLGYLLAWSPRGAATC
jgi:hypothetical protein